MSWTSSEGEAPAATWASPEGNAPAHTRKRSKWRRRTVILVGMLVLGYLLAAYLNMLPSFVPNLLRTFGFTG